MKSLCYLISLLFVASLAHRQGRAQIPSQQDGEGYVQEPAVAADMQGHVYVAGTFTGSLTFGGTTLTTDTGSGFLVQLDRAGRVEWATSLEGVYLFTTLGLAVDATGSLYLSGTVASVDSVRLVPEAPLHAGSFVACFTPEGNLEWMRAVQDLEDFSVIDLAADQDGYLYVTGGLCGFECSRLIAAKLDGQGNTVWSTRGEGDAAGLGIAVDTGGNAHLTGSMAFGAATFDEITLGNEGKPNDSDVFVGVLDAEGRAAWGYRASGGPWGRGIAVDPQGHSYVVGIYSDTLAFGEAVLVPNEGQRGGGFLVKLDAGGHVQWARRIPEMSGSGGQAVVVAESGNVYVAGNAVSTSEGEERNGVMLAAYDASGLLVSSELLENVQVGYYSNNFMALEPSGAQRPPALYLTGRVTGPLAFEEAQLLSGSEEGDLLLVRLLLPRSMRTSSTPRLGVPASITLHLNYPNPFSPGTTITFDLPAPMQVKLSVYDVLGREVAILAQGRKKTGRHAVYFEAGRLPAGVYIYRLEAGAYRDARIMLLVR